MPWEVEQKFAVTDRAVLLGRLAILDCKLDHVPSITQVDQYFGHPCRSFAATDEALRLRHDHDGTRITYKGPKIDAETKTRREIELPLAGAPGELAQWPELLEALGFHQVTTVEKRRRRATLTWQERTFEVALDEVIGVGEYVELETVADDAALDSARRSLLDLAQSLELKTPERRSYLEILLENRNGDRS